MMTICATMDTDDERRGRPTAGKSAPGEASQITQTSCYLLRRIGSALPEYVRSARSCLLSRGDHLSAEAGAGLKSLRLDIVDHLAGDIAAGGLLDALQAG